MLRLKNEWYAFFFILTNNNTCGYSRTKYIENLEGLFTTSFCDFGQKLLPGYCKLQKHHILQKF